MIEACIYPVSGAMKLWFLLFSKLFHFSDSLAWTASLFALVVSVRTLIAPVQIAQTRAARAAVAMRPELRRLREAYAERTDREAILTLRQRHKEIQEKHQYSAKAGCIPALVQVPVFLGLYQVLLRIARPKDGLDTATHAPVGLLSSQDVNGFVHSRIGEVPLTAYAAMGPEQFAFLGTTQGIVHALTLPLVLTAGVCTCINMVASIVRQRLTIDHDSRMAFRMNHLMWVFALLTPFIIIHTGLNGPIPIAICLYWVANNLWTLVQTNLTYLVMHLRRPYGEEHRAFQRERSQLRKQKAQQQRAFRRSLWRLRLLALVRPQRAKAYRAELRGKLREAKATKAGAKQRRKELAAQRKETNRQLRQERRKSQPQPPAPRARRGGKHRKPTRHSRDLYSQRGQDGMQAQQGPPRQAPTAPLPGDGHQGASERRRSEAGRHRRRGTHPNGPGPGRGNPRQTGLR